MIRSFRGILLSLTLMVSLGSVQQTYPGNLCYPADLGLTAKALWLTEWMMIGLVNTAIVGGVLTGLYKLGHSAQAIPWYQKFLRGAKTGVISGLKWGAVIGLGVGVCQFFPTPNHTTRATS